MMKAVRTQTSIWVCCLRQYPHITSYQKTGVGDGDGKENKNFFCRWNRVYKVKRWDTH